MKRKTTTSKKKKNGKEKIEKASLKVQIDQRLLIVRWSVHIFYCWFHFILHPSAILRTFNMISIRKCISSCPYVAFMAYTLCCLFTLLAARCERLVSFCTLFVGLSMLQRNCQTSAEWQKQQPKLKEKTSKNCSYEQNFQIAKCLPATLFASRNQCWRKQLSILKKKGERERKIKKVREKNANKNSD